jgi:hypothetical protein
MAVVDQIHRTDGNHIVDDALFDEVLADMSRLP